MIRRGLTFSELTVALLFAAIAAVACLMPASADTFWHLRAGEDLWRTSRVPLVDGYSYTALGRPWPNHEWLWQAVSFRLFSWGGLPLVTAFAATAATGALALVYRLMVGRVSTRFALMLIGVPLVACVWALRPQVGSLLCLAALLWLLARDRVLFIPPLFALWANFHGAVALGGVVMIAVTVAAAFTTRRRFATLAAMTLLSGLATAATPLGFGLWTFIGESIGRSRATDIAEWQAALPTTAVVALFWCVAAAFVVLLVRRRARLASWPDRVLAVAALALLPLAALAVRNIAPFVLAALPATSRLLGDGFTMRRPAPSAQRERPMLNLVLAAVFVLAFGAGVAGAWAAPLSALGWRPMSPAAARAVADCPGQVFNHYNQGGFLIWFARDKPVFVDSRQDVYSREVLDFTIDDADRTRAVFSRFGIRCAALPPASPAAPHLAAAGWSSRYRDDRWLVLAAPR